MYCYPPHELTRFLDGHFSAADVTALDDHLIGCATCRDALATLTHDPTLDVRKILRGAPRDAPIVAPFSASMSSASMSSTSPSHAADAAERHAAERHSIEHHPIESDRAVHAPSDGDSSDGESSDGESSAGESSECDAADEQFLRQMRQLSGVALLARLAHVAQFDGGPDFAEEAHVTHHAHGAKPPHCAELKFSGGQSNDRGESDSGDSSTSSTPFAAQDRSMANDASAARSPEPSLPCVPGLEVLAPIGRGGMGIVFEAYDPHLRRRVALKMISRERTSPEWTERIRLEAQAAARLNHPHVVQIYGVGECDGQPYVTLELVGGGTLADRLQGRPQSPREGAALVAKLARAVQFAHERHVVHRDLKPRNVLIDEIGLTAETPLSAVTPKITDFGLAKLLDSELQQTRTDQIMGTPAYAAPEQLNATLGEVGPATDVYALGAVFYEILTGRPPLQADDIWRTMQLVLETEPVAPRQLQPGVPRDLETICLHCLAKDPARRYVGAGELADDLDRFLADQPIRARPISAVERFIRWSRRNRALAAALAFVVVLLTVTAITSTIAAGYLRNLSRELNATVADLTTRTTDLTEARNKARHDAAENLRLARAAEAARETAEDTAYFSRIALADRAWESADVLSAKQLLAKCQPVEEQRDRRAWEWHYLNELCQSELMKLDARQAHQAIYLFGVTYSPDGKWLVTGSTALRSAQNSDVGVWDATTFKLARRAEVPVSFPAGLRFRADSRQLAVIDRDGKIAHVCRLDESFQLTVPPEEVVPGDFAPAEPIVAEIVPGPSPEPVVNLRERDSGKLIQTLAHPGGGVRSVTISPDGKRAVTLGDDLKVRVWDVGHDQPTQILHGHTYSLTGAAFHPKRSHLASIGLDLSIRIWDLTRSQRQLTVRVPHTITHGERLINFDFTPDGKSIVGVESSDQQLIVGRTSVATGESLDLRQIPLAQPKPLSHHSLAFNTASGRAVGPLRSHGAELGTFDLVTGELVRRMDELANPVFRTVVSSDGRRVAAAPSHRGPIVVWDGDSRQPLSRLTLPADAPESATPELPPSLAFSPQGDCLAAGYSATLGVHFWDVSTGRHLRHMQLDPGWNASSLAFHPNGRQFAILSINTERIAIYDLDSGRRRLELSGPASIHSLAFSPAEPRLAAVGRQGPVYLWDVNSGELILHLARSIASRGGYGYGANVKWSPDGRRLAANNWRGTIDVWEAPEQRRDEAQRLTDAEVRSTLWHIRQALTIDDLAAARRHAAIIADASLTSPHTRIERGLMWARFADWERAANDLLPSDDVSRELRWQVVRRVGEQEPLLRELVKRRPDIAELHVALARTAARQGDVELARQHQDRAVALLERECDAHPDDQHLARQLAESLLARGQLQWRPLQTLQATSSVGATLAKQDDASILVSGVDEPGDTYTITATSNVPRVAALRLEVLPDPSLPNSGPGRHPSGNFQLASFRVSRVSDQDGATPEFVPIRDAWASYTWPAPNVDVRGAIHEERRQVWHVWSRFGEPHYAVFLLQQPTDLTPGQRLVIELKHFGELRVNLGRFRLSASDDAVAVQREWDQRLIQDASVSGRSALAAAWLTSGNADRAFELLQPAAEAVSPAEVGLRQLVLARAERRRGHVEAARQHYDRLLDWLREQRLPQAYAELTAEALRSERDGIVPAEAPTQAR